MNFIHKQLNVLQTKYKLHVMTFKTKQPGVSSSRFIVYQYHNGQGYWRCQQHQYMNFNPSGTEFILKNTKYIFTFFMISQHWYGTDSWNLSSWKTRTCFYCKVNTMAADGLAMQGARSSSAMVLTWISQDIPISASEGLTFTSWPNFYFQSPTSQSIEAAFNFNNCSFLPHLHTFLMYLNMLLYQVMGNISASHSTYKICKLWG